MRVICVSFLFIGAALSASPSKLSVFVPEDAKSPFDPDSILSRPVFVVAKKAPGSAEYKTAAVPTGLVGPEFKEDDRYKSITDYLYSPGDKFALYLDVKKFYSKALYDLPLHTGEAIIVPKDFTVGHYKAQNVPVLFISEPADFDKLKFDKIKLAGSYELAAGHVKLIK